MKEIILASESPRRRQLLKEMGYDFSVIKSDYNEVAFTDNPIETVLTFSQKKAQSVFDKVQNNDTVIIGCDTVVYFNGKILGKPKDKNEAKKMLSSLSGNTHEVVSGFTIIIGEKTISDYEITKVVFNNLSEKEIDDYISTGKPLDKAGAYGIQDGFLVKEYFGSYTNIVGFPTEKIDKILKEIQNG